MLAGATEVREPPSSSQIETSRSGSGYGSGRRSTASTSAKSAVVAPMPSASVRVAASVKPGACRSRRAASDRSRHSASARGNPTAARTSSRTRSGDPRRSRASRAASVPVGAVAARGLRAHLEVEAQLLLEVAVELRPPEEQGETVPERGGPGAHAVSMTRAIAAARALQRRCSASSRRRPRAVRR